MATINISLPQSMYDDAKKVLIKNRYASISELMRDALRRILYQDVTENGFTTQFESQILQAAADSVDNDLILETSEDINNYFKNLKISPKKK